MTDIIEQVTYTTRAAIYSAYPASDQGKRQEAADILGLKVRSFMRKLESNTDSRKELTLGQAVLLMNAGHIVNEHMNKVLAPAKKKIISIDSDTPLNKVLTIITQLGAVTAAAFEDLQLTPDEKRALLSVLDLSDEANNRLRLACGEPGVTKV